MLLTFQSIQGIFGKRCFQYMAAITGTLGILSSEMHFGWPSPSLPVLRNGTYAFQISSMEASWLAVTILIGMVIGAVLSAFLADMVGRKNTILLTSIPLFISWIMIGVAKQAAELFIARLLGGTAGGISFATVPMYLGEISDPKIRGLLSSLCPIFVVAGILAINALGNFLPIDLTAYISSSIPLLMLITFFWMPESPIFLLTKNKNEEARKTLWLLRGNEDGEVEYSRLMVVKKEADGEEKPGLLALFLLESNRRAIFVGFGLRSIQQFCGSTAITFFCKTIFEESREWLSPNISTILYFSLQAVFSIFTSFLVDIFGRRPLLLFSLGGTVLTLFVMGIYLCLKDSYLQGYTIIPLISLFANVAFFSLGTRNVPLLMMSEMFHTDIKPKALCLGVIYYSLLAILVTKFYYITSENMGMAFPFAVFGVVSFLCMFFVYFCVPETKGKTLEDIQEDLKTPYKTCCCCLSLTAL